jgi:tRNA-(ms[2]io[6]A)-hydroxylase
MSGRAALDPASILCAATPAAWVEAAAERWRELLIDHASCEKKAASSALALMFAYPEDSRLGAALSRLARRMLRTATPGRKLDLLLTGALIEARSAERFRLLAPRLPAPLGALYAQLERSEARHFEHYLEFARAEAPAEWQARLAVLAAREAELATCEDRQLRFHSGPPRPSGGTAAGAAGPAAQANGFGAAGATIDYMPAADAPVSSPA